MDSAWGDDDKKGDLKGDTTNGADARLLFEVDIEVTPSLLTAGDDDNCGLDILLAVLVTLLVDCLLISLGSVGCLGEVEKLGLGEFSYIRILSIIIHKKFIL